MQTTNNNAVAQEYWCNEVIDTAYVYEEFYNGFEYGSANHNQGLELSFLVLFSLLFSFLVS